MPGLVTARVNAAVDAAVGTIDNIRLHTGDPGGAGTANVAAGVAVRPIDFGASTGGVATAPTVAFTIPGAGGPYSYVSLWIGSPTGGGTYAGSGVVAPAESFAGPGSLDVDVTVTGTSTSS